MKVENLIGKTYKEVVSALSIEEYGGDCGGWAYHTFYDEVAWHPGHENAVLSNVLRINYSDDDEDGLTAIMNFFFALGEERDLVLGYALSAGSDSGESCGAYCSMKYNGEEIANVSW